MSVSADRSDAVALLMKVLGWESPPARVGEALTHPSFSNEQRRRGSAAAADYQRLEFLGDAVLGLCVSELLMVENPEADEGALSRMRSSLVKADALAAFARTAGVGEALRLGRGADAAGDRHQTNVLADAVEALVAAAYLEGGLEQARELVRKVVSEGLGRASDLGVLDPKSELQERVQSTGRKAPTYRVGVIGGPEHERWFEVEVVVGDDVLAAGRGKSKKIAEREAARAALVALATLAEAPSKATPADEPRDAVEGTTRDGGTTVDDARSDGDADVNDATSVDAAAKEPRP